MDRFNLEGRVAVVTGGTRGLGAGFAEALTDAGASVMLAGRDAERGRAVSQALAEREATACGCRNLRHLGSCFAGRRRLGPADAAWRAGLGSGWRAMIFGLWA
jgi:NAD(P)-dependent dehydrogenase (short-subunit alcohol dehydrogenase family)